MLLSLLFSFQCSFRKSESEQRTAASENDELPAIHLVGDWRISDSSDRCMPQSRAVTRTQRHCIAWYIAREGDTGIRRQDSGSGSAVAERVVPFDLPRLIINRA